MAENDSKTDKHPVLTVKDGGAPNKESTKLFLGTLLDTTSDNFLGSGLTFAEWNRTCDILRYDRWYGTQTRDERQRRMKYIIQLCVEQDRVVQESIHATGLSQSLIEEVIAGDWSAVKMWIEALAFDEMSGEVQNLQNKRFQRFREIAQEAYETRPKVYCPVCTKPTPGDYIESHHDGRHVCPWCKVVHDNEGNWVEQAKANLSTVEDVDD